MKYYFLNHFTWQLPFLLLFWQAFTSSRTLLADSDATPVSSPLLIDSGKTETEKAVSKPSKVQAVLKGIKQV